jgi:DNA-binding MarR family transcriptional regulator
MKKRSSTEKIISLMFNLGRSINKQYFEENRKEGKLSILQVETLRYIREEKEVLMKDLAKHLFIAPPSATSLVDDLVKAKLLGRVGNKQDRRTTATYLTAKGKRTLKDVLNKKMEKVGKMINKLTAREKKLLLSIFEKLSRENN